MDDYFTKMDKQYAIERNKQRKMKKSDIIKCEFCGCKFPKIERVTVSCAIHTYKLDKETGKEKCIPQNYMLRLCGECIAPIEDGLENYEHRTYNGGYYYG